MSTLITPAESWWCWKGKPPAAHSGSRRNQKLPRGAWACGWCGTSREVVVGRYTDMPILANQAWRLRGVGSVGGGVGSCNTLQPGDPHGAVLVLVLAREWQRGHGMTQAETLDAGECSFVPCAPSREPRPRPVSWMQLVFNVGRTGPITPLRPAETFGEKQLAQVGGVSYFPWGLTVPRRSPNLRDGSDDNLRDDTTPGRQLAAAQAPGPTSLWSWARLASSQR
jgi:hypothetical protein